MYCENCGKYNADGVNFCMYCGHPLPGVVHAKLFRCENGHLQIQNHNCPICSKPVNPLMIRHVFHSRCLSDKAAWLKKEGLYGGWNKDYTIWIRLYPGHTAIPLKVQGCADNEDILTALRNENLIGKNHAFIDWPTSLYRKTNCLVCELEGYSPLYNIVENPSMDSNQLAKEIVQLYKTNEYEPFPGREEYFGDEMLKKLAHYHAMHTPKELLMLLESQYLERNTDYVIRHFDRIWDVFEENIDSFLLVGTKLNTEQKYERAYQLLSPVVRKVLEKQYLFNNTLDIQSALNSALYRAYINEKDLDEKQRLDQDYTLLLVQYAITLQNRKIIENFEETVETGRSVMYLELAQKINPVFAGTYIYLAITKTDCSEARSEINKAMEICTTYDGAYGLAKAYEVLALLYFNDQKYRIVSALRDGIKAWGMDSTFITYLLNKVAGRPITNVNWRRVLEEEGIPTDLSTTVKKIKQDLQKSPLKEG